VIDIQGKGGHGAMPHLCVDPINVGVHIHLALQELVSRETPPSDTVSLTIGAFQAGDAANVIPHTAQLSGTLRTYNEQTRQNLKQRMQALIEGIAASYRATATLRFLFEVGACTTDAAFLHDISPFVAEVLGEENCNFNAPPIMPSEDFSEITARVPSAYMTLGFGDEQQGCCYAGHHPKVVYRDEGMPYGTAVLVNTAVKWLHLQANQA
jgi:amidohydrolase